MSQLMKRLGIMSVYFVLSLVLVTLVPPLVSVAPVHDVIELIFGYENNHIYLALVSSLIFLFDYLTILIPLLDLVVLHQFIQFRQVSRARILQAAVKYIAPYFILFMLLKLYILKFVDTPQIFLTIGVYGMLWLVLIYSTVKEQKQTIWLVILAVLLTVRILMANVFY